MAHPIKGARKRTLATYASYDFDHWTQAVVPGFRRDPVPPHPRHGFRAHTVESRVHMGASLWNRGNVLVGIYGQYHNETNDRRYGTCDLGMVTSNDAMHFREPVPDFKFVPYYEELDDGPPRLLQGQGFANEGERSPVLVRSLALRSAAPHRGAPGHLAPGPHGFSRPFSWVRSGRRGRRHRAAPLHFVPHRAGPGPGPGSTLTRPAPATAA